jgi:hypothetical protein
VRSITTSVMAMLACLAALPGAAADNSAATITAAFADGCRIFAARSSKDISHVELHYADGRIVKDESIVAPGYEIGGGAGDELETAIVKSGTTSRGFECRANVAPVAKLEIKTPPDQDIEGCYDFWAGGLLCEQASPRVEWMSANRVPDTGGADSGLFHWACGQLTHPSLCSYVISFRGSGSTDADGDITRWSLDFGDGTSASGSWATDLPGEVSHDYSSAVCLPCVITLTVTDAAGQSSSKSMKMVFLDLTPD